MPFLEQFVFPVLVAGIIFSFAFYVFYKIKYVRSRLPMERKILNGKSSVALGLFVALFGINHILQFHTPVSYIISSIFIVIGLASAWYGYKVYKYHVPYALRELEEISK